MLIDPVAEEDIHREQHPEDNLGDVSVTRYDQDWTSSFETGVDNYVIRRARYQSEAGYFQVLSCIANYIVERDAGDLKAFFESILKSKYKLNSYIVPAKMRAMIPGYACVSETDMRNFYASHSKNRD